MIPYVEIRDRYTYRRFAIIEPKECWFELSYYDIGEFEIKAPATPNNLKALRKGNFATIPNKPYIWLINSIRYTFTANGARLVVASGYEAKWLLRKRAIQTPVQLPSTLSAAIYKLFDSNIGANAGAARKINGFEFKGVSIDITLTDTQAPRGNLGEYIEALLKANKCGSQVIFEDNKLKYTILQGQVRSSVVFSQSMDNLISSDYYSNDDDIATNALVVSTVENIDYTQAVDLGKSGIDRGEIIVSSNLSTKYEDASGVEQETTPTSTLYKSWQTEEGKKELAQHTTITEIKGEIDLVNTLYEFEQDFYLGDLVRARDEYFNFDIKNTRILKYTISQDTNGYNEIADYGE